MSTLYGKITSSLALIDFPDNFDVSLISAHASTIDLGTNFYFDNSIDLQLQTAWHDSMNFGIAPVELLNTIGNSSLPSQNKVSDQYTMVQPSLPGHKHQRQRHKPLSRPRSFDDRGSYHVSPNLLSHGTSHEDLARCQRQRPWTSLVFVIVSIFHIQEQSIVTDEQLLDMLRHFVPSGQHHWAFTMKHIDHAKNFCIDSMPRFIGYLGRQSQCPAMAWTIKLLREHLDVSMHDQPRTFEGMCETLRELMEHGERYRVCAVLREVVFPPDDSFKPQQDQCTERYGDSSVPQATLPLGMTADHRAGYHDPPSGYGHHAETRPSHGPLPLAGQEIFRYQDVTDELESRTW